jgi:hypothetical protein
MENQTKDKGIARSVLPGLLLATALFTSACGGGDGEAAPAPKQQAAGPGPLDEGGVVCEFVATLLGGECVGVGNMPNCSDDWLNNPLGLPSCSEPASSGFNEDLWITPRVYGADDIEPNDSISSAAPARLNSRLPGGRGGFLVKSTFNTSTDPADVFIFTLSASANIEFTLCFGDTGCRNNPAGQIDVGTAYINVLDQSGALIWSAADDAQRGNIREIWLDAGVPYYAMLVAADTMDSDIAYRFSAIEAQSQINQPVEPVADEQPGAIPEAPLLTLGSSGGTPDTVTFTLDWLPPTENLDGTALVDLSGYRIYYGGLASDAYSYAVTLDNPGLTSYVMDLPNGDYSVAMTTLTAAGLESDYSNEVIVGPGPMEGEEFPPPTPGEAAP